MILSNLGKKWLYSQPFYDLLKTTEATLSAQQEVINDKIYSIGSCLSGKGGGGGANAPPGYAPEEADTDLNVVCLDLIHPITMLVMNMALVTSAV